MRPVYYASGSNRPADIRGFRRIGHPIGVAAPEVSGPAETELLALKASWFQVPLFVDSGAFSEVAFGPDGPRVVAPIDDAAWRERLALYGRLARVLGPQVALVAPDRVGDQSETLARLTRYRSELLHLRDLGARILVPLQKGALSQRAFLGRVVETLGFDDFVHAIPSKKEATTDAEIYAYLGAVRPRRVHFLGLGVKNPRMRGILLMLQTLVPDAEVSCDSNLIAANVGRGAHPRPLTRAQDMAREVIRKGHTNIDSPMELGIMLAFGGREFRRGCGLPDTSLFD